LKAALHVFSQSGFSGASMDLIAKEAGLSKPTLYQYFDSKDALFKAMMAAPRDAMMLAFQTSADVDMVGQMLRFSWVYAETVMRPDFLSLARLVIAEAHRFPEIGRDYQASGPDKVLAGLMAFLDQQRDLGRLRFDHTDLAAEDFWGLILSGPRNRALHNPDIEISHDMLARSIQNGLAVFLRAYSTNPNADLKRLTVAISESTAS